MPHQFGNLVFVDFDPQTRAGRHFRGAVGDAERILQDVGSQKLRSVECCGLRQSKGAVECQGSGQGDVGVATSRFPATSGRAVG